METLQSNWAELSDRVRRFIGSRVNDPHAADDITQDVLLKAQKHLDALPPAEKLPAWLITTARNAVVDHYRARPARDNPNVHDLAAADDPAGDEQRAALQGLSHCLLRMVEHLPEPYRQAMKLADIEGLSQQEIADRAGVSLSGAKSRIQRARRQLREMLQDCCPVEQDARGNVVDYHTTEQSARYCGDNGGKPPCG